jgi:uncharacterized protein with HEPN domain
MQGQTLKWLYDIQSAIIEIESYFDKYPKNFSAYVHNLLLKRAIERDLEIIGEAVNRLYKENPDIEIENAKRIIVLRNQIIHAYDNISDENIWAIVVNHIPRLKAEVGKLIKQV